MARVAWGTLWAPLVALTFGVPGALAAEPIVIRPGEAQDRVLSSQRAAPTRYLEVEKALTLAPGQSRVGANLVFGGLGLGAAPLGPASGLNVRADSGVQQGLEAGIGFVGIGAGGAGNVLVDVGLRAKLALGELSVNDVPVELAAASQLGGFLAGGGLTSGSVGVALPLTAGLAPGFNLTLAPGFGLGYAAENPFLGSGQTAGLFPTLGCGLDLALSTELSLLVDGRLGWTGGFHSLGNVGLRYGVTDDWAADLCLGYRGNPLAGGLHTGTLGMGATYAF